LKQEVSSHNRTKLIAASNIVSLSYLIYRRGYSF